MVRRAELRRCTMQKVEIFMIDITRTSIVHRRGERGHDRGVTRKHVIVFDSEVVLLDIAFS